MADWGEGASGALSGAAAGMAYGPAGAVVGGVAGGLIGLFGGKGAPQYDPNADPNVVKSRVLADNLLSSKTGEDFAAHSAAMNEHRGQQMFDEISRGYSGNPAVSSALYDKVERNTENENTTAGIEGARINQDNARTAAGILQSGANLGYSAWKDGQDRASRPSALDTIATGAIGRLAGAGAAKLGETAAPGDDSPVPPSPTLTPPQLDTRPTPVRTWDGTLPSMDDGSGRTWGPSGPN